MIPVEHPIVLLPQGARITVQRQRDQSLVLELAPQPVTVSNMHGVHPSNCLKR